MTSVDLQVDRQTALAALQRLEVSLSGLEGGMAGVTAARLRTQLLDVLDEVKLTVEGGAVDVRPPQVDTPLTLALLADQVADDRMPWVLRGEVRRLRGVLAQVAASLRSPLPAPPAGLSWVVLVPDTNTIVRSHHFDDLRWREQEGLHLDDGTALLVVIPQLVYDELDDRKNDRDNADRRHAKAAAKKIEGWASTPATAGRVQDRVHLVVLPEERDHTRLPIADNEIVDVCRRLRATGERVLFLSIDAGARTRARGQQVPASEPADELRRVDKDPVEEERDQALAELERLKRARPDIRVLGPGGTSTLLLPAAPHSPAGQTAEELAAAHLAEHPAMDLLGYGRIRDSEYEQKIRVWAQATWRARRLAAVAVRLDVHLHNVGGASAQDIELTVALPDDRPELQFATAEDARETHGPRPPGLILDRMADMFPRGHLGPPRAWWSVPEDRRTAVVRLGLVRHGDEPHLPDDFLLLVPTDLTPLTRGVGLRWRVLDRDRLDQSGIIHVRPSTGPAAG